MFDCHIHSSFSGDSEMKAENACEAAIDLGLEGIAFTDHLDYDYPDYDEEFLIDFDKYNVFMDGIKQSYGRRLKVLKGVEVGIQPQSIEASNKTVGSYAFDFVIGSVHVVDGMDPYFGKYFIGKSRQEAFSRYFEAVYDSIACFDNFDVVGHIGYIRRYCSNDDKTLKYSDFSDILDSILNKVISKGKGIEVNTSGYRSGLASPIPDYDIVRRYKELGGEIICMGSDAHCPEHIAVNFDYVKEMLFKIGFKYITHFENRKPIFEPIIK